MGIFISAEDKECSKCQNHLIVKYKYSVCEIQHANSTILINLDEKSFHDEACSCITSFFFCSLEICKKYEVSLRM